MRCPNRRTCLSARRFDRCHNSASLHPPPAALGSVSLDVPLRDFALALGDFVGVGVPDDPNEYAPTVGLSRTPAPTYTTQMIA